jgi:uncharacterized protein (TIGR01777 family)
MKVLVTGATGFLGRRVVARRAARGDAVVAPARKLEAARVLLGSSIEVIPAPRGAGEWAIALRGADAVLNLAGEPVIGRWTDEKKRAIRTSRVDLTAALVAGIASLPSAERPKVLVQGSAIGLYGGDNRAVDEGSAAGSDALATLCLDWEAAAASTVELGVRLAIVRIGVVLGRGGGALEQMVRPFKLGLGGRIGAGDQWISWIALDDCLALIDHVIDSPAISGPLNAVAPHPCTNRALTDALGAALHRPTFFVAPAFALRVLYGEGAEVLLGGQQVTPTRTLASGFTFAFPELRGALEHALSSR